MKQFNESYAVATPVFASIAIPPTPAILLAIREAHQQNASLVDIAQLISQDDSLVMAVLKAINSSFYCLRERICSIEQAIKLLGMRNISILIIGLSLRNITPLYKYDISWCHHVKTALVASNLVQLLGAEINQFDSYLFGLFHDCGKILLFKTYESYQETLVLASTSTQHLVVHEMKRYATDHALVGALLSQAWCLPEHICAGIKIHHDIHAFRGALATKETLALIALNNLAEYLASKDFVYNDSEWLRYSNEFMEYLKITDHQLTELQSQVDKILTF